jgi:hypothetical protein
MSVGALFLELVAAGVWRSDESGRDDLADVVQALVADLEEVDATPLEGHWRGTATWARSWRCASLCSFTTRSCTAERPRISRRGVLGRPVVRTPPRQRRP